MHIAKLTRPLPFVSQREHASPVLLPENPVSSSQFQLTVASPACVSSTSRRLRSFWPGWSFEPSTSTIETRLCVAWAVGASGPIRAATIAINTMPCRDTRRVRELLTCRPPDCPTDRAGAQRVTNRRRVPTKRNEVAGMSFGEQHASLRSTPPILHLRSGPSPVRATPNSRRRYVPLPVGVNRFDMDKRRIFRTASGELGISHIRDEDRFRVNLLDTVSCERPTCANDQGQQADYDRMNSRSTGSAIAEGKVD